MDYIKPIACCLGLIVTCKFQIVCLLEYVGKLFL